MAKTVKIEDNSIHSISFGDAGRETDEVSNSWLNTWRDWHLVPTSRPVVNPPKPRTEYVTVAGRDGVLDYSDALDGVHYDNRTGSWEFAVYHEVNEALKMNWADVYSDILTNVHGLERRVILKDDPEYYYVGRINVNQWKSDKYYSLVIFDYDLDPFKYSVLSTGDFDWQFNDAIAKKKELLLYAKFTVATKKYRNFVVQGIKSGYVTPVIWVSSDMQVQTHYQDKTNKRTLLKKGSKKYKSIKLYAGDNYLTFYGNGTVNVYYNLGASL